MARVVVSVTDLTPPKASLTTALTGANNDLVFTARQGGPGGNSIRIQYVVSGTNTVLSVAAQGYDIIVTVATDGAGSATSTATQVKSAIESNADATRLVSIANAAANDGSGIVTALSLTNLTGGALAIAPPTQVDGDTTNGHYFTGNDGMTVLEVVSSDASSRTVSVAYSPHYASLVDIADEVVTVPASATRLIGPFLNGAFDQNSNRDVYFTPSISTTLKFRAYRMVRAS